MPFHMSHFVSQLLLQIYKETQNTSEAMHLMWDQEL